MGPLGVSSVTCSSLMMIMFVLGSPEIISALFYGVVLEDKDKTRERRHRANAAGYSNDRIRLIV